MHGDVHLREVLESDLHAFYEHQLDPAANRMAAFVVEDPTDREAFLERWARILNDDSMAKRTILCDGRVAGHVLSFEQFGHPAVSYWIGRAFWNRGVATRGLEAFLALLATRPIWARAAKDNLGSIRVLEKCGFKIVDHDRGFSHARGEEVEEVVLKLG